MKPKIKAKIIDDSAYLYNGMLVTLGAGELRGYA